MGLAIRKAKTWPWGWGYLNPKQRRQQNIQKQRKIAIVWRQRSLGRVKNYIRGHQKEIWYKIWIMRQLRQLRMGISE